MFPCGYMLVSDNGLIQEVNQFICNLTGYSKDELNNEKSFIDLFTRGSRIYYETHLLPILQLQKVVTEIYFSLLSKEGKIITVLVNAQILTDEETGATSIHFAFFSYSHRKLFEEELVLANKKNKELIGKLKEQNELDEERDSLIRGLLKEAPMALFSFQMDEEGVMSIPYYNNVFASMFAEAIEQDGTINTLKVLSRIHPDYEEVFVQKLMESYHNVAIFTDTVKVFGENHEIRFMKIIAHPTKHDFNLVLWKGSLEDITEKILIDQQLKKIEIFSKGVLNSLSSNISVIDTDGNIVAVNGSWDQFSITNGEPSLNKTGIGANYFTLLENAAKMGDESALDILKGIKDVIEARATCYSREYECHTPNEKAWFRMNVAKFEGDESKVIITHENITQSKLAEEQMQRTHQKLNEISWMQSHIVRAPLAKIMSIANLLNSNLDQIEKQGKFKDMLHLLTLSANELDDVIRKISDKARQEESFLQKNEVDTLNVYNVESN